MATASPLGALVEFRQLDELATSTSGAHRLEPRAKLIIAAAFLLCVTSFGRHAIAPLLPYFVFPIAAAAWAGLPLRLLARKVAMIIPVALVIALPNLYFDREPVARIADLTISGGWLSLVSIVLRAMLAAAAAIVLVAVTGLPAICAALERLGMPRPLAVQLLLLYRYLIVLGEEASRVALARELRDGGRRLSLRLYGALVGRLLLRTWDRADRIYLAMCARGFAGDFTTGPRTTLRGRDLVLVVGCCAAFLLLRKPDLAMYVGRLLPGLHG